MFTKLRNRFLIVNLVTISVIMLVAFISIYVITYQDVQNNIQMDLHRIMENYKSPGGDTGRMGSTKGSSQLPHADNKRMDNGTPPPERSVSFMLKIDTASNLIGKDSKFTMDDEFYNTALQEALSAGKDTGRFTLIAANGSSTSSIRVMGRCLYFWTSLQSKNPHQFNLYLLCSWFGDADYLVLR